MKNDNHSQDGTEKMHTKAYIISELSKSVAGHKINTLITVNKNDFSPWVVMCFHSRLKCNRRGGIFAFPLSHIG